MTKRIFAIDPGSKEVGLYWGPGQSRTLCLINQKLSKSKQSKVPRPERLAQLAEQLADVVSTAGEGPFDFAVYEEQFVRGDAATRALYGAVGVIEAVLTSAGVGVMSVPQATLRKWTEKKLGEARSGGPKELYAAMARLYDASTQTEHEHDACVLWNYIQEQGKF